MKSHSLPGYFCTKPLSNGKLEQQIKQHYFASFPFNNLEGRVTLGRKLQHPQSIIFERIQCLFIS